VEMPPFQPPIVRRAAIEQFYRNVFRGPLRVTGFAFTHTETAIHGYIAYDIGTYKRSMSGPPTAPIEAAGAYMVILKHTETGGSGESLSSSIPAIVRRPLLSHRPAGRSRSGMAKVAWVSGCKSQGCIKLFSCRAAVQSKTTVLLP
jgi:hypothetical protein